MLLSFFAAVIPMLFYLIFLWKMDKYEREPLGFVFRHFLWGAFGAVFFGILGSLLLAVPLGALFEEGSKNFLMAVFTAPLVEESAKGYILFKTTKNKNFDNLTDGLVYGGAVGLGFGMTENFLYFVGSSESLAVWLPVVLIRTAFTAVMHAISTGTFGAFLAFGKFSSRSKRRLLTFSGLLIAMLIHFAWNFSVSFDSTALFGFIMLFFLIITFLIVLKISVQKDKEIITRELRDENLSDEAIENVLSPKGKIIDKNLKQLLVKLAVRKNEFEICAEKDKAFYHGEIVSVRKSINKFLEGEN
ncbi:MAG: PrsW family intramembrane metalloprotease [Chlorobi bacterium]|nr:PrsW family intramembrane metalloprotease [Chlorobiota bacterium]